MDIKLLMIVARQNLHKARLTCDIPIHCKIQMWGNMLLTIKSKHCYEWKWQYYRIDIMSFRDGYQLSAETWCLQIECCIICRWVGTKFVTDTCEKTVVFIIYLAQTLWDTMCYGSFNQKQLSPSQMFLHHLPFPKKFSSVSGKGHQHIFTSSKVIST